VAPAGWLAFVAESGATLLLNLADAREPGQRLPLLRLDGARLVPAGAAIPVHGVRFGHGGDVPDSPLLRVVFADVRFDPAGAGRLQRLEFARAIVRDPDVLVLDEATSSVDPATERRIQAAFERIMAGRTTIVIAHRLATVATADRILVMHQGRLAEEGTHRELYDRGGIYRDLVDLQLRPAAGRSAGDGGTGAEARGNGGDGGTGGS